MPRKQPPPRSRKTAAQDRKRKRRGTAAEISALAVEGAARPGRVCVGAVAGAHGVAGEVRIKSFTERSEDIAAYGPLADEKGGRVFTLTLHRRASGLLVGAIEGIDSRETAEALRGTRLYVDREQLPEPADDDEFYHADLLGLSALGTDGRRCGRVAAILPVGDATVLEIDAGGEDAVLVPFTREHVPEIDIAAGHIVIEPPEEPLDEKDAAVQEEKGDEHR